MKLDVRAFKYLSSEDWRVLTSVEVGSKNHEVVPTQIISQIANLRGGIASTNRSISNLAKPGLIAKVKNTKYDGYRLTYGGLDYLALHAHIQSGALYSVGPRIGVGKESDIYACCSPSGTMLVLKLHRLGRVSFRAVKNTRDYLRGRKTGSWLYLSRLAAAREFAAMQALYDADFPVPRPVACNRHAVVMDRIDGMPLYKVNKVSDPGALYEDLSELAVRLAKCGVIHGDLNEFNIMLVEENSHSDESEDDREPASDDHGDNQARNIKPILIDFPQIISTTHADAAEYFARDIACLKRYFGSKLKYDIETSGPTLEQALDTSQNDPDAQAYPHLDIIIEAAGFSLKKVKELEELRREIAKSNQSGYNEQNEADTETGTDANPETVSESESEIESSHPKNANNTDVDDSDADAHVMYPTYHNQVTDGAYTLNDPEKLEISMAELQLHIRKEEPEGSVSSPICQSQRKSKNGLRSDANTKSMKGWAI